MLWEYVWSWSAVTLGLYKMNWVETDTSGNGRDFTATNETRVEDWLWWAMSANWSTTTCRNAAQALSAWNSPYTISFRVKLNAEIASGTRWLIDFNPDATLQDTIYALEYAYNAGTRRLTYAHYYNWPWTEVYRPLNYNITLWTTNWYDIVLVYTWSAMTMYINWTQVVTWWWTGVFKFTWVATYQSWFSVSHYYYLSAVYSRSNCRVDEVVLENRAWTFAEVKKQYTYSKWRYVL